MLKQTLCELVRKKIENTKARLAYKAVTPVSEPNRELVIVGYWSENAALKEQIRSVALARAYLRGQRYWFVERSCAMGPLVNHVARWAGVDASLIHDWIEQKPTAEELEAWGKHVEASKTKYRAIRAARRSERAA